MRDPGSLDHPFPASWTVRRARDAYLAENGFTVAAYDDRWTDAAFLGLRIRVPNTPTHQWAIRLHDLHHVATGYGTDLAGEGEISIWEARRGFAGLDVYVSSLVLVGTLWAPLLAPRRALAAYRAAGAPDAAGDRRPSLFAPGCSHATSERYEALLALTVGELRDLLGVPREGLAKVPRELHAHAPLRPTPAPAPAGVPTPAPVPTPARSGLPPEIAREV